MQAFRDEADPCIMFKIINILRNTMRDVEVYICWPEDLQQDLLAREPRNSYNEQFKRRTLSPADLRPNETEFNVNRTETESGVSKSRNIEDKVIYYWFYVNFSISNSFRYQSNRLMKRN